MLFWEFRVTHKSREESLDGVGCFPVSPGIQVIGDVLEFLLVAICFPQTFNNLFLVILGNILQNRSRAVDFTHLPRCARGRLLDAGMPIRDDQLNPGESPFFEAFEQSRPELLILTIRDSRTQDLPVAVFSHLGTTRTALVTYRAPSRIL